MLKNKNIRSKMLYQNKTKQKTKFVPPNRGICKYAMSYEFKRIYSDIDHYK